MMTQVWASSRALDAGRPNSVLCDTWVRDVMDQVDYTSTAAESFAPLLVLRASLIDAWATVFLQTSPEATVLHLACGLDSRAHRLSWGPGVSWVDVDMPKVIEIRDRLLLNLTGDYRLVSSSVTESAWLEEIPADRPVLVIMEGLVMYLDLSDAENLMKRICDRFPCGQMLFDAVGWTAFQLQAIHGPTWQMGARYRLYMNDPRALQKAHPKLKMKSVKWIWEFLE